MTLADAFGVTESDALRWPPDVAAVLARVAVRRGWLLDTPQPNPEETT